jgi:osmoprotectant transport system permease protein
MRTRQYFKYFTICTIFTSISWISIIYSEEDQLIKIGSKKFTESVILGEITTQMGRNISEKVIHIKELGGTRILWNSLLRSDIDIYPEYTGTIIQEILSEYHIQGETQLEKILESFGIKMSKPLGFNNTYALGMKRDLAEKLNVNTISDLRRYPYLNFGFTNEFLDRGDGWPNLKKHYNLPQDNVRGLDHDLAYRGLESDAIDIIDLYSTDAEIEYYDLKVLSDDQKFFTDYKAVLLYRSDLQRYRPNVLKNILKLENTIDEFIITEMNSKVKLYGLSEQQVAGEFLRRHFNIVSSVQQDTLLKRLISTTIDHLILVLISLSAAIFISIPLGILSFYRKKAGQIILGISGIFQTIPSLALLVFMIPLLGIGAKPAIFALFLYSLLPIIRNTFSGLNDIPNSIRESGLVLGISTIARLRRIEIPLASRSILAGIKTSAVINIGTATLGALIGAGGYGQPILTGIRLDNTTLILEGAIPAACLALIAQSLFELLEIFVVPKGLRIGSQA